jgi:hypothetical protein
VEKKAFLRRETQTALVPFAVFQNAEVFEEFAGERLMRAWHRNVMGGPGIGGDFIFAAARVASGFRLHFQDDEIAKAFLLKTPCRSQPGDSSANDDDGDFFLSFWCGERSTIAKAMAEGEAVVDELSFDAFFGFCGETDEGGGGYSPEKSPSGRHGFSVAFDLSPRKRESPPSQSGFGFRSSPQPPCLSMRTILD